MSQFIRSWRSKIEIVTLGVAILLLGAWMRSSFVETTFAFTMGECRYSTSLYQGSIEVACWLNSPPKSGLECANEWRGSNTPIAIRPLHFRAPLGTMLGTVKFESWATPLSLFVVPLLLLSVYFLMAKPRLATDPAEPVCPRSRSRFIPQFFTGWKPQIGVLTLIFACIATAGWVRSLSLKDEFSIRQNEGVTQHLISNRSRLGWKSVTIQDPKSIHFIVTFFFTRPASDGAFLRGNEVKWEWHRTLGGFEFGRFIPVGPQWEEEVWIVPYWSIVLPLTAISAFLLLSKPKQVAEVPG